MTPLQSRIPACAVCVPAPRCLSSGADGSQGIYVRALGAAGQVSNVCDAGHRDFFCLLRAKYVPALNSVSGILAKSLLALTCQLWHARTKAGQVHNGYRPPRMTASKRRSYQKNSTNNGAGYISGGLSESRRVPTVPGFRAFAHGVGNSYWCPLCGREYWTQRDANECRESHPKVPHDRA